jgi:3-hydroxypropionate dehydrogenase (NADP+)
LIKDVDTVACVGSGLIGQGWITLFTLNGYNVIMHDLTKDVLKNAKARVGSQMRFLKDAGLCEKNDAGFQRIKSTTDLSKALENADFVIESIYESYEAKKLLYSEMDKLAGKNVILASSTSGLLMTEIQKVTENHPSRCIVTHPYNPTHLVPLVEICPGELTSKKTVDLTYLVMKDIGKIPIILHKEVPGFIANRLSAALWREALDLVDKGVASVEDVDLAVRAGPGIRWAIMGPYLTYHLGGGTGGIEYLLRHIGVSKSEWLEDMAKWTVTPESAIEKAIKGTSEMAGEKSLVELESWRDKKLVKLVKFLWKKP